MDKIRVFITDDSPVARNILKRMLNDEEDIEVVGEAGTAGGSITALDETNPDVILLESAIGGDMGVPLLMRSIKDIKPYIRIILCVGVNAAEDMIKGAEPWTSDIIRKPYNKTSLLRAVRNI